MQPQSCFSVRFIAISILVGLTACGRQDSKPTIRAVETTVPEYYGVFLVSKDNGLHELQPLTTANFAEKAQEVALEAMSSDANAYIVIFQKGFDPTTANLSYVALDAGPNAKPSQVDVMVKPKGEDKYLFVPRAPLKAGNYMMRVNGMFDASLRTFVIGDKQLKDQLSRDNCVRNLRLMDAAKDQWAIENNKADTDTVTLTDTEPYIKGGVPKCPAGGTYTVTTVGAAPECSIPRHTAYETSSSSLESKSTNALEDKAVVAYRQADVFLQQRKFSDASKLIEQSLREDPGNTKMRDFLSQIQDVEKADARRVQLETQFNQGKGELNSAMELAGIYRKLNMEGQFQDLTMNILNDTNIPPSAYLAVAKMCAESKRTNLLAVALEKYLAREPKNPKVWIDLAAIQAAMQNTNECMQSLGRAIELGGEPARDTIRKDARFNTVRETSEFRSLVPPI